MKRKEHWERIYRSNRPTELSWFQAEPALSLRLIENAGIGKDRRIIDVGGGGSALAGCLLRAGFERVAVLDISAEALRHAQKRLGARAGGVEWLEADVRKIDPPCRFDLWHDRAAFHFLVKKRERQAYMETLRRALAKDGQAIIATFAADGPARCSGLAVARYDAAGMSEAMGAEFELVEQVDETHVTPSKAEQRFSYFRFRRLGRGTARGRRTDAGRRTSMSIAGR